MNTARKIYRITRAAIIRELSKRFGYITIGTGEYLRLDTATHYSMTLAAAHSWAMCYPSAVIVTQGAIVASYTPAN
jgi:non-ribosomal peptide synthetase component E (peptide arylation enzyme)